MTTLALRQTPPQFAVAPAPLVAGEQPRRTQEQYTAQRNALNALYGDEPEPTSTYYSETAPDWWLALPVNVPPVREPAPVQKQRRKRSRKELR